MWTAPFWVSGTGPDWGASTVMWTPVQDWAVLVTPTRTETIRTVATLWPPFHLYLRRQSWCPTLIPHRSQQGRSSHHSRSRSDLGSCVRLPDVNLEPVCANSKVKGESR